MNPPDRKVVFNKEDSYDLLQAVMSKEAYYERQINVSDINDRIKLSTEYTIFKRFIDLLEINKPSKINSEENRINPYSGFECKNPHAIINHILNTLKYESRMIVEIIRSINNQKRYELSHNDNHVLRKFPANFLFIIMIAMVKDYFLSQKKIKIELLQDNVKHTLNIEVSNVCTRGPATIWVMQKKNDEFNYGDSMIIIRNMLLPETVMNEAIGKKISDVIEMPMTVGWDAVIRSADTTPNNSTLFELEKADEYILLSDWLSKNFSTGESLIPA